MQNFSRWAHAFNKRTSAEDVHGDARNIAAKATTIARASSGVARHREASRAIASHAARIGEKKRRERRRKVKTRGGSTQRLFQFQMVRAKFVVSHAVKNRQSAKG